MPCSCFLSVGALAILSFLVPTATLAATFYIDPSGTTNGNGTQASPFNSWNSVWIVRGNTYLQKAGTTYPGLLYITSVQGTASLPVIIDRYGTGAAPVVTNTVSFDNSSYVTFQNFTVTLVRAYASIAVQSGSTNIRVLNNSITNGAGSGLFLGSGCNNVIAYNTIHDVAQDGIVVEKTVCTNSTQTLIYRNTIYNTGIHGIELYVYDLIIYYNIIHAEVE